MENCKPITSFTFNPVNKGTAVFYGGQTNWKIDVNLYLLYG